MADDLYARIREELNRNYGPALRTMMPKLVNFLSKLNPSRTHFVYELLQNAEDACERARQKCQSRRFVIRFELTANRLEIRHNGIPFDEDDVRGVCRVLEGTKEEDTTQIGKYGVGFKSVFNYTTSPEIYSGDKSFHIRDIFYPYPKEARKDVQPEETLFVMHLDKEGRSQEEAYLEIERELTNMSPRVLLFLKNIEEISFRTNAREGRFLRRSKTENGVKIASIHYFERESEKGSEEWLIFDKPFYADGNRVLEIAFLLQKGRITVAKNVKLFAYFPTEKETHLKFLVQGPYHTTPARDNIEDDEHNRKLIEETATLVSDSISKIKILNLLDVGFLDALPIDTDHFVMDESLFEPIYDKVKEKLCSSEPFLPTYDGNFATVEQALIARGEDLRRLLTGDQLDLLFGRGGSKWLDPNITENRTPELWEYLTEVLQINVIDPESFARAFNEDFIEKQTDQWVVSFYDFLANQKALWREAANSWERLGVLRSKPIIRLEDSSHKAPFDVSGRPNVYLPPKDSAIRKQFTNFVKETIIAKKCARDFLRSLGVDEPDIVATVLELVLPLYDSEVMVSDKDNVQHVEMILQAIDECSGNKRENLISELENTRFMYAINASNKQGEYRRPAEIHLGQKYTTMKGLEAYFEGNEDAWFLDDRYLAIKGVGTAMEKLRQIGCRSGIRVRCRKPDFMGYVEIVSGHGWHSRGLDGFDPDCEVEGLDHALRNINIERSRILWQISKEYRRSICGEVERSTRKSYDDSTKSFQYSKMGKLLVDAAWLSDENFGFHKASEIMLSDLPDDFDKESHEAKYLAEKLRFKPEPNLKLQELFDKTPDEVKEILNQARPILEMYISAPPEQQQLILESVRNIVKSKDEIQEEAKETPTATISVCPTPCELWEDFNEALEKERPDTESIEDKKWSGPTPEEEEEMRKCETESLSKILGKPQTIVYEATQRIKSKGEPVLRAFFLEQYKGHCQVCDVKLDLGPNKDPWFEIFRIDEKKNLHGEWSDQEFNTLCVCPNCHALMKKGGRKLQSIIQKAKRVAEGEEAPEEVSERHGSFYIVNVSIAGKERELFYTPAHMAKVSAFVKFIQDHLG